MTFVITKISVIVLLMVMFVGMIVGIYASIFWGPAFNKFMLGLFQKLFGKAIGPKPEQKPKKAR